MFNNPTGYGYPQQPMYGYNYGGMPVQQQRKQMNFLSDEEIDLMQNNKPKFNLQPTPEELRESKCNHRNKGGLSSALDVNPDGPGYVCRLCHHVINPVDPSAEKSDVQSITNDYINVLETIKILFADFPADAADFFTIIPLVKKTPELFEMAIKSIRKYGDNNPYGFQDPSNNTNYLLNNFMAANGFGGFGMGGFGAQPMYQQPQPQAQPQFQAQPMMGANPAFGYNGNPFGYNGASQFQQPQFGYQPGTQGFSYQPQAQEAPAADTTTTTTNNQA